MAAFTGLRPIATTPKDNRLGLIGSIRLAQYDWLNTAYVEEHSYGQLSDCFGNPVCLFSLRFAGGKLGILAYLFQMSAHRTTGRLRIATFYGLENALVMNLPALRAAFDVEDFHALLPQQADDGIDQRKNQRIRGRFRQGQVEIEIGLDVYLRISLRPVHHRYRFAHGCQMLFPGPRRSQ